MLYVVILPNFVLWQMLLPICFIIQHILCQMLYQYMVADVEPILLQMLLPIFNNVADVNTTYFYIEQHFTSLICQGQMVKQKTSTNFWQLSYKNYLRKTLDHWIKSLTRSYLHTGVAHILLLVKHLILYSSTETHHCLYKLWSNVLNYTRVTIFLERESNNQESLSPWQPKC